MELLTITLAAGESKRFEKPGRYFEIIDSSAAVRVDFYSVSGQQTDQMQNALSGLFLEAQYGSFVITSATAQTISFLLLENGRGGSRRQPGMVTVIDRVASGVSSVNTGAPVLSAHSVAQILAPQSGVVYVRAASMTVRAGASSTASGYVVAAPSLPAANGVIPVQSLVLSTVGDLDGTTKTVANFSMNRQIPQGWGIYLIHSFGGPAQTVTCGALISYEVI